MGLVPAWGCSYITNPLGQVKPTSGTVGAYAWTYVTHSGVFDSYIPSVPETGSQTVLAPTTSGEMLDWAPYAVPTDGETETIASLGRGLTDLSFGEGLACAQCVADVIAEGVGPQLPPDAKAAVDAGRDKAYVLTLKAWAVGALLELGLGWAFATEVAAAAEGVATPWGVAMQEATPAAEAALADAQAGATIFREGVFGVQETTGAQFWSPGNPAATPGYAAQMGMPGSAAQADWIMGGTLQNGATAITRGAPGIGVNIGGGMEVVVQPGGVGGLWFHMP